MSRMMRGSIVIWITVAALAFVPVPPLGYVLAVSMFVWGGFLGMWWAAD